MGGLGSSRWGWHSPKTRVESCWSLALGTVCRGCTPAAGRAGTLRWNRGGQPAAAINYIVVARKDGGLALQLRYTVTPAGREPVPVTLDIPLFCRPGPRGGHRWLGVCPLAVRGVPCGRPVGTVHLPPGGIYFGCRTCHRLTYRSQQTHDARVSRLLRNPHALLNLNPRAHSVAELGLILNALTEFRARIERDQRRARRRSR